MNHPPKNSSLAKLMKVILPFKSPPPGEKSVMGWNKKYGRTIEAETKDLYHLWIEMTALPTFFTYTTKDKREEMANKSLEVYESVHSDGNLAVRIIWQIGGKPSFRGFKGEGGEYSQFTNFPYTVLKVAKSHWTVVTPGEMEDELPDEIYLVPPPTDVGWKDGTAGGLTPFKEFFIQRHNLLLKYASWAFDLKHLNEIEVVGDEWGLVLKHKPTGKTRPLYEPDGMDTLENATHVMPTEQMIPLKPDQWEIFLMTEFDIPMKDAPEKGGEAIFVDAEEFEIQQSIDDLEKKMLDYWNKHQELPKTFSILVDKIGKRKEYSALLRRRMEFNDFTHMRENPSTRKDWENWKKFFFDRDLSIVKRKEYSYLTEPRQWEPENEEEEEMDQEELNALKIEQARDRARNLLEVAKDAEKNAKTEDDRNVAKSLLKIAYQAIDNVDEDEYGTWENDIRSDSSETENFEFEMDDHDGKIIDSAVERAANYLIDEKAVPIDSVFTPTGEYYQEDTMDDPETQLNVEYSLEGDWTRDELEHIWFKVADDSKYHAMRSALNRASEAELKARGPDEKKAALDAMDRAEKMADDYAKFRKTIPELIYPKDIYPDEPDFVRIDDYAEHGKCVVKKEYRVTPVYADEGDSDSEIVESDSEEIDEIIESFEPDDSGEELWEQAARYINYMGGSYNHLQHDPSRPYETEPVQSYSDDSETHSTLKPYGWTPRELEKISDWIAIKHGGEALYPEPADVGSEHIQEIVLDDQEELEIEQSIDAIEREMVKYYRLHPGSALDYNSLATAIGKRKEYSDLLRRRDSLIRENPISGQRQIIFYDIVEHIIYDDTHREVVDVENEIKKSETKEYDDWFKAAEELYYDGAWHEPQDLESYMTESTDSYNSDDMYSSEFQLKNWPKQELEMIWDYLHLRSGRRPRQEYPHVLPNEIVEQKVKGTRNEQGKMTWNVLRTDHSRFFKDDEEGFAYEKAAELMIEQSAGYNDVDLVQYIEEPFSLEEGSESVRSTRYIFKNWDRRDLERISDDVLLHLKKIPYARFPEKATSETMGEIVIDDKEELEIEQSIDALEREMIKYHRSHPGSPFDYSSLSTAIGKRKEYSDLLRQRDSLIRENPGIPFEIDLMLSGNEPIRVTGMPPSLIRDLATEKKIEKALPGMLSMLFDAHIPGAVGPKTVKDNIVLDCPMYDHEYIEILPWTKWANWKMGGIKEGNNRQWPYEIWNIASVSQPGLFVAGGEKVHSDVLVIYGVPCRDDDIFAGLTSIFYDRLLRIFQYGYYKAKFPIFGLISPVIISPKDGRNSRYIGLVHKETGKRLILDYNHTDPGPGFANDNIQMDVTIPLHHNLDDAKFDAAVVFNLDFAASTDVGGQPISVDQEELEVQTKIDAIEKEMQSYSKTHPNEPTAISYVSEKIGKKDEYVRLIRLRMSLMED
jgi:hypothetical protein